ncbi:hypothetical protein [uncultured Sphaerochaeta sp.]|uniref:hypothetical protein n=1 Tax=uncultured Sphaerochaeta sp. TaxID=886478 RepID=UPI0026061A50|nr:hypothetical protein [uncultured Sphaerochaeta sp.]
MARLGDIKSDVVAAASGYNPTMDFPVPELLMNYIIITCAANVLYMDARSRRSTITLEPWMATTYCLSPVALTGSCVHECVTHEADLGFTPMDMPNEGAIMYAKIKGGVDINLTNKVTFGMAKSGYMKPSTSNPMGYIDGGKLYLAGGSRDFSKCQIMLHAVAIDGTGECPMPDDSVVPIPDSLVPSVVEMCVRKIAGMFELQDTYEEGNQKPKTPE